MMTQLGPAPNFFAGVNFYKDSPCGTYFDRKQFAQVSADQRQATRTHLDDQARFTRQTRRQEETPNPTSPGNTFLNVMARLTAPVTNQAALLGRFQQPATPNTVILATQATLNRSTDGETTTPTRQGNTVANLSRLLQQQLMTNLGLMARATQTMGDNREFNSAKAADDLETREQDEVKQDIKEGRLVQRLLAMVKQASNGGQ
jgi:hypothetical protein